MIALLLAVAAIAQAAASPTGTIRVHAIDKETGEPLARAQVQIVRVDVDPEVDSLWMTTDERGSVTFGGLAPGRYRGAASARRHVREPLMADGSSIPVAGDQTVEVSVAVARTHAINVRVVDPFGDPLTGVLLEAIAEDDGRVSHRPVTTDDLGRGRVFDLWPGRYTLCAAIDDHDIPSRTGPHLLRTCYPATDDAHAEPIRVGTSDVGGIEIRMRRAPTHAIAGVVSMPPGISRADAWIAIYRPRFHSPVLQDITVDADGRFRLLNVEPGHYAIVAFVADDTHPNQPRAAAFAEVRVEDADVDGVVIAVAKTVAIHGRVIPEDPGETLPRGSFEIEARLAGEHVPGSGSGQRARAGLDWTFTIEGVFGRRVFNISAPSGWYVKSLRYGGTEIIDAATELAGGREAPSLDVILSRRGAVVTGTVVEDGGKPAPAIVCLLRTRAADGSVVVAARGTAARDGTFSVGPVRGGDYALVALPASSEIEIPSFTQDRLTRLAVLSERVTLSDVDERSVQLRLMRER